VASAAVDVAARLLPFETSFELKSTEAADIIGFTLGGQPIMIQGFNSARVHARTNL
jgi:hypothetical protein